MSDEIKSFEDFHVWQRAIDFAVRVYHVVEMLPPSERSEMSSQLRRAAASVPSNVAAGHTQRQAKPFLDHVNCALGSLAEVVTCLVIANRVGFISGERLEQEMRETDRIGRMLHGLARSLEERLLMPKHLTRRPSLTLGLGLIVGALAGWLAALL